jgi:ABC-type hemin transport system ATPase subunit
LGLSQPQVNRHIGDLERTLGVALFVRSARHTTLTGAGGPRAGLDLTLPAGRSIALGGENGGGKTTLVKLLCGMYHPSRGRVLIDEVDLAEIDPGALARRMPDGLETRVGNRFTGGRELSRGRMAATRPRRRADARRGGRAYAELFTMQARVSR